MRTQRWGKFIVLFAVLAIWSRPGLAPAAQRTALAPEAVSIIEYPTQGTSPSGIAAGPDGAVWYTVTDAIERIAPNGAVTRFALTAGSGPARITAGPDGALWFTQISSNRIGRITTAGTVQNFPIPTTNSYPNIIAAGPDGALWFTEALGGRIGRVTTGGAVTEFVVGTSGPTGDQPYGIAAGPDGALWFTEKFGNRIGRITTGGAVTKFPIPTPNSEPHAIVAGPDGALWFVERVGNKVGRITTAGVITEYPMPTPNTDAFGIAVGSDGALWYVGRNGNRIGRATTGGAITDYPIPTLNAGALFITRGPDGDLWFVESQANKIGRVRYRPDTDVSISKEANLSQALPGQPISYTIIYRNAGLEPAASVRITDTVPLALGNLAFTSSRPITAAPGLQFAWDAGTLAPNASGVITVTGIVSPNLRADLVITNTVQIGTSANDIQPGNNAALAAVRINVPRVSAAAASVDEGGQASLRVSLAPANPFAPAVITYASANGTAVGGADYAPISGTLTFPPGTAALTLTLNTLEDRLDEADETVGLALQPVRGAALGSGPPAVVTIIDDDTAAILVAPTAPLTTSEDGAAFTFTVRLDSQPFSPVTIPVGVSDASEAQVSATALIFTASTWSQPQSITVTGLDDALRDGDVAYQVTLGQAVSGDPAYAAINPADLAAVNLDNEDDADHVVYAPLVFRAAPIPSLPVRLAAAIPTRPVGQQGEVFYQATATVNYDGGPAILAGNAAGTASSCVDDRMTLVVTRPDSTQRTFTYTCLAPGRQPIPLPPTDFASYLLPGINSIAIEFRDVYGSVVSSTDIWLGR